MKRVIIFLSVLALVLVGIAGVHHSQAKMTVITVGGVTPVADSGFSCTSGNVISESFDASGYDLGECGTPPDCWTEAVTSGTVDEDATCPSLDGFDTTCLNTAYTGLYSTANTLIEDASEIDVIYMRVYLNVDDENYTDANRPILVFNNDAGIDIANVRLTDSGGQLQLQLWTVDSGIVDTENISVDTSYALEIYLSNSGSDAWEWKLNGSSVGSGSGGGYFTDSFAQYQLGVEENDPQYTIDLDWDNFDVDTTGWLGECS